MIDGLSQRGFTVVHEVARAYIDSQLALGCTLAQIKSDILSFERHILYEKVRIEQSLNPAETVFLDRAVPDSIAYFQMEGLDWREPLDLCRTRRYRQVFLLDPLIFEKDAVRSENRIMAARIDGLLETSYRKLGYAVRRVPLMPVKQRIDHILDHIRPAP